MLQWRSYYYQTFLWSHNPLLVIFYSVNEVKCDQNVEYGTIKSLIVRISPLYPKLFDWNKVIFERLFTIISGLEKQAKIYCRPCKRSKKISKCCSQLPLHRFNLCTQYLMLDISWSIITYVIRTQSISCDQQMSHALRGHR